MVIAHRLDTILHADKVAVLKNGKLFACDTHARLYDDNEEYRRLFEEQYAGLEREMV